MKKIFLIATIILSLGFFCIADAKVVATDIILSPHLDDAALPVGGLLAKTKNEKLVVSFFTGTPDPVQVTPWDTQSGFANSTDAMLARIKENDTAMSILGATNISLNFLDFQYRALGDTAQLQTEIQSRIEDILREEGDEGALNVYFPAFFGETATHPDHILVHNAVLAIITAKEFPQVSWYMYEDMPYTMKYEAQKNPPLQKFLQEQNPDFSITQKNILLPKDAFKAKMKSIQAYTSQLSAFAKDTEPLSKIKKFISTHCGKKACEKVYQIRYTI